MIWVKEKEWHITIKDVDVEEYSNYVIGFTPFKEVNDLIDTVRVYVTKNRKTGRKAVTVCSWHKGETYYEPEDTELVNNVKRMIEETEFYNTL